MRVFYHPFFIVLLASLNIAGWMAFDEADEAAKAANARAKESERLHKEACTELNELRSTIAAGGTVEL